MKVAIVGGGITGLTWARLFADRGDKVVVFDERPSVGGNCLDYRDKESGVYVHQYGAHIFHTNREDVWAYVNRFTKFNNYVHRVMARTDKGNFFIPRPASCEMSDEAILEYFFKAYSVKQWGVPFDHLPKFVKDRVPRKRDIETEQYFLDKHQGIPEQGFEAMFDRMVSHPNIGIAFSTYVDFTYDPLKEYDVVIATGSIDRFFQYSLGKLPYRSARFVHFKASRTNWKFVVNDCTFSNSYTRTYDNAMWIDVPNKWNTVITEEYPIAFEFLPDPPPGAFPNSSLLRAVRTHPILEQDNLDLYEKYSTMAKGFPGKLVFSGRLGRYKYINMDEAVGSAMDEFNALTA